MKKKIIDFIFWPPSNHGGTFSKGDRLHPDFNSSILKSVSMINTGNIDIIIESEGRSSTVSLNLKKEAPTQDIIEVMQSAIGSTMAHVIELFV